MITLIWYSTEAPFLPYPRPPTLQVNFIVLTGSQKRTELKISYKKKKNNPDVLYLFKKKYLIFNSTYKYINSKALT